MLASPGSVSSYLLRRSRLASALPLRRHTKQDRPIEGLVPLNHHPRQVKHYPYAQSITTYQYGARISRQTSHALSSTRCRNGRVDMAPQ